MTLISTDELRKRIDDPDLRVADVRWYLGRPGAGRAAYEAGHVPGAVFVDLDTDLADPGGLGSPGRHPLPDPTVFARRLEALGIGDEHLVVAYDDVAGGVAARLWWMLDDLGHERGAVLDGGIQAWLAAGGGLTTDPPAPRPARLHLRDRWTRVIDRASLAARLGDVLLLDARSGERYRGETEPVDPVAGHIPTAVNAPLADNLRGDVLRPATELASVYEALGADERPTVVSCGSGVNACATALALRVAGLPDPLLYAGSYSEWSRTRSAVATGAAPGLPQRS